MKKDISAWESLLDELEKTLRELEQRMTTEEFVRLVDSLYKSLCNDK